LEVEESRSIEQKRNVLLQQTQDTMSLIRDVEKETSDSIRALERVVANERIYDVFQELMDSFQDLPKVWEFLNRLIDYILDNLSIFKEPEASTAQSTPTAPNSPFETTPSKDHFLPFYVNVLVDESGITTVPIIIEPNPNWGNLFGRIERRASSGTYFSDHTMLKPGAIHLANGGYLVLNARDLMAYPGVWEGLKRVIRNQEIRLEDPSAEAGFFIPQGMRPEPIPLNLKVIITGDEALYRTFTSLDYEDFWDLFKVKAEFDSRIDITRENLDAYAAFICRTCEEESLLSFDSGGVSRVI
jgi:predicted ATP-dependent protease